MFMSLFTVLNNNKNYKNGGAYWNRGAYLQKHILWGALIRKGALIGRRALNRIITVLPIQYVTNFVVDRLSIKPFVYIMACRLYYGPLATSALDRPLRREVDL